MIDRDEVLRIAALARLKLSPDETERMAGELSRIVEYVAQLSRVTGQAPPPEAAEATPRREDRAIPSRVTDELLALAPAREGALARVPRVIEER